VIRAQADHLRQPFYHWYSSTLEATCDALAGRYADEAAHLAAAGKHGGAALGRRPLRGRLAWDFVTRWDLGGLEEIARPLLNLRQSFPGTPVLDAAAAHLWCETGHNEDARTRVAGWLTDLRCVPEDSMWLFSLVSTRRRSSGLIAGIASDAIELTEHLRRQLDRRSAAA
jgi:hypothetical protein